MKWKWSGDAKWTSPTRYTLGRSRFIQHNERFDVITSYNRNYTSAKSWYLVIDACLPNLFFAEQQNSEVVFIAQKSKRVSDIQQFKIISNRNNLCTI